MTDAITLTIPREQQFFGVARLVVGGLAARLDVSYDSFEDLQLALDSVLNQAYATGEHVTVELTLHDRTVDMAVGPLDGREVQADLDRENEGVGLRRLLSAVVERIEVEERDGSDWVRLEKRLPEGGSGS